jgi:dihydroorotase
MEENWIVEQMGEWLIKGGRVWRNRQLVANQGLSVAVNDTLNHKIRLSDDDFILPGMVDMHCHVKTSSCRMGVSPNRFLASGVVCCLDAGSLGCADFAKAFVQWDKSGLKVDAMLSVLPEGLTIHPNPSPTPPSTIDPDLLLEAYKNGEGRLQGFKIRLGQVDITTDEALLRLGRHVADRAHTRLMVHLTDTFMPPVEVLTFLKGGDILSHPYHGMRGNILNKKGRPVPALADAVEKGLVLDAACGRKHFSLLVYGKASAEGLKPHIISTDYTEATFQNHLVRNLAYVISRFIAAGLSEEEAFKCVIDNPLSILKEHSESLNSLVVLGKTSTPAVYSDIFGELFLEGAEYTPKLCIVNGCIKRSCL